MTVLVCDPGVDDVVALAVLAAERAGVSAVVATSGNVDVETSAAVASRAVAALRLRCAVAADRRAPDRLLPPLPPGRLSHHGADGFGGHLADLPAAPPVGDASPGVLDGADVLVTGPLTAVAEAVRQGAVPRRLLWMGGAVCGGSVTAAAEFNAWCDPVGADQVLASGLPVEVVPLDVTSRVQLSRHDLDRWRSRSRFAAALAAAFTARLDNGHAVPHDAVAAVAWLSPQLFRWEHRLVRCEPAGTHTTGALVVDRRPAAPAGPVRIAVDVDADEVHRRIVDAVVAAP